MANLKNQEAFDRSFLVRTRCQAIALVLNKMYPEYEEIMSDLDLIIPFSFSDQATSPRQSIPSLTFCKEPGSNNILIPSINNLVGFAEFEHVGMYDVPLLHKSDKMCFAGSLTNIHWNGKGIKHNQRLQIADMASTRENLFARIVPPKEYDDDDFKKVYDEVTTVFPSLADSDSFREKPERVSMEDQLKNYRFHLCIDGHVCAWARLPWHLLANVVPIKIRNPDFDFMEWYYPLLNKSRHFLEVDMDQIDEVYEWLKNDVEAQLDISRAGREFVETYISTDLGQRIFLWTLLLMSEKQQLFLKELE